MYDTFKEACKVMGLLEDDAEWEIALEEVTASGSSHQIRAIFAVLLQFCQPTDPGCIRNLKMKCQKILSMLKSKMENSQDLK